MLQITRIDLHHKLQLLIWICFLLVSSVICKVFVVNFEHVFFCWKSHSTETIVILILKYLPQQTNTYSKSAAVETLKASSRDCASLLTTCSRSISLFKCFLVYYEHVLVYCDVFAVTISFSMYLLSILNRFHTLSTFICYQFCTESRRSHQRCSLKKGVL